MLSAQNTVAEIVTKHSACASVFQKHRIDFCCRGDVAVSAACTARGLETAAILAELEDAIVARGATRDLAPEAMTTEALIDHIVSTHHEYLRKTLPFIRGLAAKVRRVHGEHNPRLVDLDLAVQDLEHTLVPHLDVEEQDLFPLLVRDPGGAEVTAALATMHEDHQRVGEQLARIREASEDFQLPEWACKSYRTLFAELEHLESDVFRHVHLENHVLMPRFARM